MIVHMRIDNRLIHGQVAVRWVGSIGATHLIVSNDEVADDPIQQTMLPLAARGVKTSVLSIEDTVRHCKEAADKEKIMIIAKFPSDALALLEKGIEPMEVNVGNQAPLPGTKYKMVTKSIAVTADDAIIYRKINEMYHLTSQMLPSDSKKDFIHLIEDKGL